MEKYIIVLSILIITSFIYLKLAVKYKIIDKPNIRSSHKKITVRGGGIVFVIAFLLFFILNDFQYPYLFTGVIILSLISFLDDIYTLSSKIRFPFQFLTVFLILFQISFPFNPIYFFLLAFVFGVGIVNMFNFMDGINGLTGLYSLATLFGLYLINENEAVFNSELIIYLSISILVFGFYNFRKKAIFFAGDIGSIALGMLIFFLGIFLTFELESPLILLLVIVYGADAGNTLLYRKFFTKESILEPHRHHIYQKLVDNKKMSHIKISLIYAFLQVLVNLIIYKTYSLEIKLQLIVFVSLVLIFMITYIYLFRKLKA